MAPGCSCMIYPPLPPRGLCPLGEGAQPWLHICQPRAKEQRLSKCLSPRSSCCSLQCALRLCHSATPLVRVRSTRCENPPPCSEDGRTRLRGARGMPLPGCGGSDGINCGPLDGVYGAVLDPVRHALAGGGYRHDPSAASPPFVVSVAGADDARTRVSQPAVGARHGELMSAARALTTRHAGATKMSARARPELCRADAEETLPPFLKYAKGSAASQKRTDLKSIMILGAGPIVIGQVRYTALHPPATHPNQSIRSHSDRCDPLLVSGCQRRSAPRSTHVRPPTCTHLRDHCKRLTTRVGDHANRRASSTTVARRHARRSRRRATA